MLLSVGDGRQACSAKTVAAHWATTGTRSKSSVIVRPFNHTGPGQEPRFAAPAFAEQIAKIELGMQGPVLLVGDLTPERDFLDVRDVCEAYLCALCHGEIGETYNIASGTPRSIQSVLEGLLVFVDQQQVLHRTSFRSCGKHEIACLFPSSRAAAAKIDSGLEKNRRRVSNFPSPTRLGSDGADAPQRKEAP